MFKRSQTYFMRVLFFGTDEFALQTLKQVHASSNVKHLEIVTPQERPQGRGRIITATPIFEFAKQHDLPVHVPPSLNTLRDWQFPASLQNFDLGLVVSFRYFVPARILKQFGIGAMNVHPSLLPRWRGAAPLHWTLLNNDQESGVTLQELHPEHMDAGNILLQERVAVLKDETYPFLHDKLANVGAQMVAQVLQYSASELKHMFANAKQQDITKATDAPKVNKSMGQALFEKETRMTIYNKWRAFYGNIKSHTFLQVDGGTRRLILIEMQHPDYVTVPQELQQQQQVPIGHLCRIHNLIFIKCVDGWVACSKVQLEGKSITTAVEFARGAMHSDVPEKQIYSMQCVAIV